MTNAIAKYTKRIFFVFFLVGSAQLAFAQPDDDLLSGIDQDEKPKEYIKNAFKSSRVINGHSMEFIGKGVLDVRILHRFGDLNSGFQNLFGLDQATMRFGFDYGVAKNLTIGLGRSTFNKEWDGFIKYRLIHQSKGGKFSMPISLVFVTGTTVNSSPWSDPTRKNYFTSRLGFYNQMILGRKFSEKITLQLSPTHVHLNLVKGKNDYNDIFAMGFGARYKLNKRIAFVADYHMILRPESDDDDMVSDQFANMINPLSVGFDIETGGHVFQLHFTNASGMNEKAFITGTTKSWGQGQVSFGFNLSRVFTVGKK
jgi:hypothetical protein